MNFNQPEEEFIDGDDVIGLGVLGKEGSGRLRMQAQPKRSTYCQSGARLAGESECSIYLVYL